MAPARKTTISTLSNATNQSASRLMSLAPELRNRIYEFIFEDQMVTLKSKSKSNPSGRSKVPGILMTCKQTYTESLHIFFNKSVFLFTSMQKLGSWMRNIGPANRRVVGRVDFRTHHNAVNKGLGEHSLEPWHGGIAVKIGVVEQELKRHGVVLGEGMLRVRVVCPIFDVEAIFSKVVGEDGVEKIVKGGCLEIVNY
ncbi:hypothetical protein M409DRAFT_55346 [Zasmidium cellare ATCC 36951]|uniref:Uncharacterized protein n=1 Tax=Zasmidium cellare ATCC 36951 TaxID=1080233 RepID=A0A6A6CIG7_ZASCE|nr:uncharacterized protein M409DRAFT_55346 [Zasmidium cellare ATCC 36951]KAF2165990.1 hypothetical protein M409DRAFT_55346 [Zasmidium cellare ATCC 36951]